MVSCNFPLMSNVTTITTVSLVTDSRTIGKSHRENIWRFLMFPFLRRGKATSWFRWPKGWANVAWTVTTDSVRFEEMIFNLLRGRRPSYQNVSNAGEFLSISLSVKLFCNASRADLHLLSHFHTQHLYFPFIFISFDQYVWPEVLV